MSITRTRRPNRVMLAEALESRTFLSATPTLLDHLAATGKPATFGAAMVTGTAFTVQIKRGTVDVYQVDNRVQLVVTPTDSRCCVTLTGDVELADVLVSGSLKLFDAEGIDVGGNMSVHGSVAKMVVSSISGTVSTTGDLDYLNVGLIRGMLAVGGSLDKLVVGALANATILSGANMGADHILGGNDDTFSAGFIKSLVINGPMINSTIAVGYKPGISGLFGTSTDASAGGGMIDKLRMTAGADDNSRIEAGGYGTVQTKTYLSILNAKRLVDPLTDTHFHIPPVLA